MLHQASLFEKAWMTWKFTLPPLGYTLAELIPPCRT
jgi:hypothetical protein